MNFSVVIYGTHTVVTHSQILHGHFGVREHMDSAVDIIEVLEIGTDNTVVVYNPATPNASDMKLTVFMRQHG